MKKRAGNAKGKWVQKVKERNVQTMILHYVKHVSASPCTHRKVTERNVQTTILHYVKHVSGTHRKVTEINVQTTILHYVKHVSVHAHTER